MARLDQPRCVRRRHGRAAPSAGMNISGKAYAQGAFLRAAMVLLGILQPGAGGILALHLLRPLGALLQLDGETLNFLVLGGFLWGCHRGNCLFLGGLSRAAAFPGQGAAGAFLGCGGLLFLGSLGVGLYIAVPALRDGRRLLCALAAVAWGLFGVMWHKKREREGTQ